MSAPLTTDLETSRQLAVGKVSGLFGTRGWVKLYSYTRPPKNLIQYPKLIVGRDGNERGLRHAKSHGNKLVGQFEGIDTRDAAAALVGETLFVDRNWLSNPDADEYYWADLIGLEVVNQFGVSLGRVVNLYETGANDVLQVEGERQYLIPFVLEIYVFDVDLENGVLRVDWHPED